ncbi:uncharacterized protein JCM15063_005112 [Sporobolomyces koalae]|uniref:uncharacterized protein n=1 Tax=Sporobolomyces koalae TaxID=500713 RepID=UPI00316CB9F6
MSLSDLTRSYTTFPSRSQTATPTVQLSPIVPSSTAREGASNVPGYSIAAGHTNPASLGTAAALATPASTSSAGRSGGVNEGLALGLGLGLGISAVLVAIFAVFVLRTRKSQKADFERRAQVIRDTVETSNARTT